MRRLFCWSWCFSRRLCWVHSNLVWIPKVSSDWRKWKGWTSDQGFLATVSTDSIYKLITIWRFVKWSKSMSVPIFQHFYNQLQNVDLFVRFDKSFFVEQQQICITFIIIYHLWYPLVHCPIIKWILSGIWLISIREKLHISTLGCSMIVVDCWNCKPWTSVGHLRAVTIPLMDEVIFKKHEK